MTMYRCIVAKSISICNVGRSALISEYVQKKKIITSRLRGLVGKTTTQRALTS